MSRRTTVILASAALACSLLAPAAEARGGHGGGHFGGGGGHFGGGGGHFGGGHGFRHHGGGFGFVPFGFGYGYAPYGYGYGYDYGYDCTRVERVPTPYGFRWRRVYVC